MENENGKTGITPCNGTRYKLAICTFPGQGYDPASERWIKKHIPIWARDERIDGEPIVIEVKDTPISMCRNAAVHQARERAADYILMIDADEAPDCEMGSDPTAKPFWASSWEFMMRRREEESRYLAAYVDQWVNDGGDDVCMMEKTRDQSAFVYYPPATIAAPYCGAPPIENVFVFKWARTGNSHAGLGSKYDLKCFDREHAAAFTGIFEVAALPTGLIFYDARVFDRLPQPWFEYEYEDFPRNTKKITSEDVYQTRNASLIGMPQFCNWDAWAGHRKVSTVRKPLIHDVSDVPDALATAVRNGSRGRRISATPGSTMIQPRCLSEIATPTRVLESIMPGEDF